ncbi:hypothetical protein [Janibacter sp. GXQ6167]|uniref:hypothetical protein n=1 Tax=Janibacter sp. GXQ6167 TaxID=3240791 RepID=UPI003526121E
MSAEDRRSVGELLLDSELAARDVLMDADEVDGAAMLRTWGEVVESAGDLWDSLPRPHMSTEDADYSLMAQLQAMNGHLMRAARGRQWPGEGDPDERLLRIAENLTRASDLLTRRRDSPAMSPEVRADLGAARARLVHTLYIGAHGVHVTLDREVRNMQARRAAVRFPERSPGPDYPNQLEFQAVSRTRDRIAAFEQLAGSYVSRTYPHALEGEHKPPPQADRLRQALATWDVQAHRGLSRSPSAENIFLAAQTQMMIAQGGQVLLRAAGQAGRIDADLYATRVGPAMDNAHAAWSNLSRSWSHLMPPHALVSADRSLVEAANEVRAAYRDVAYDRTRPADAIEIADRVDLSATAQTVQQSISSSVDVAHVIGHATHAPDVRAPARLLNVRAQQLQAERGETVDTPSGGWVTAGEHVNNAPAVLPDLVREELQARTDEVAASTSVAMGAASSLETRTSSPTGTTLSGRSHQDRTVAPAAGSHSFGPQPHH